MTTVSHFSLYFAAKANEEEQRDRAQGVQSTRRAESQDIPSGNFSSEFSFDRAIFFFFLKLKFSKLYYIILYFVTFVLYAKAISVSGKCRSQRRQLNE